MANNETSSLILYAADEPTTVANTEMVEQYIQRWGPDFGFFCGQALGLMACSLKTEEMAGLLDRANELAGEHLLMLREAQRQDQLQKEKGFIH